jgi:hypothetical protein
MHFKIQPLQRRLVTLERRNFKYCAKYQIFFLRHFRLAQHSMHSHSHKANPNISPPHAPHRSQRVTPTQVPSLRVTPRMNPNDVASPRVTTALPLVDVIPLTPHPAAENSPYMPQGMAGMSLFDTSEEEHMETPVIPKYNTRASALQHSSTQAHTLKPRIFRPISFTSNQAVAMPF